MRHRDYAAETHSQEDADMPTRMVRRRALASLLLGIASWTILLPIGFITGPLGWWCGADHLTNMVNGHLHRGRRAAQVGKLLSAFATIAWAFALCGIAVMLSISLMRAMLP